MAGGTFFERFPGRGAVGKRLDASLSIQSNLQSREAGEACRFQAGGRAGSGPNLTVAYRSDVRSHPTTAHPRPSEKYEPHEMHGAEVVRAGPPSSLPRATDSSARSTALRPSRNKIHPTGRTSNRGLPGCRIRRNTESLIRESPSLQPQLIPSATRPCWSRGKGVQRKLSFIEQRYRSPRTSDFREFPAQVLEGFYEHPCRGFTNTPSPLARRFAAYATTSSRKADGYCGFCDRSERCCGIRSRMRRVISCCRSRACVEKWTWPRIPVPVPARV